MEDVLHDLKLEEKEKKKPKFEIEGDQIEKLGPSHQNADGKHKYKENQDGVKRNIGLTQINDFSPILNSSERLLEKTENSGIQTYVKSKVTAQQRSNKNILEDIETEQTENQESRTNSSLRSGVRTFNVSNFYLNAKEYKSKSNNIKMNRISNPKISPNGTGFSIKKLMTNQTQKPISSTNLTNLEKNFDDTSTSRSFNQLASGEQKKPVTESQFQKSIKKPTKELLFSKLNKNVISGPNYQFCGSEEKANQKHQNYDSSL